MQQRQTQDARQNVQKQQELEPLSPKTVDPGAPSVPGPHNQESTRTPTQSGQGCHTVTSKYSFQVHHESVVSVCHAEDLISQQHVKFLTLKQAACVHCGKAQYTVCTVLLPPLPEVSAADVTQLFLFALLKCAAGVLSADSVSLMKHPKAPVRIRVTVSSKSLSSSEVNKS